MMKFNQNNLDFVVAMYHEKNENQISWVSNKETLKGVVIFCEQKAVGDVDFVVKKSFNTIAVIARIQPQVDLDLPVLVLSEEEFIEVIKFGIQNVKVDLQCYLSDDKSSLNDEGLSSSDSSAKNISDVCSTFAMARTSKKENFCETKMTELRTDSTKSFSEQHFDLDDDLNSIQAFTLLEKNSCESFSLKQKDLDSDHSVHKTADEFASQPTASKVEVPKDDSVGSELENINTDQIDLENKTIDYKLILQSEVDPQYFLSDDNSTLKRNQGSHHILEFHDSLISSGSKTERITDTSISPQSKLESNVAEIDPQSKCSKDNSTDDYLRETKEKELQSDTTQVELDSEFSPSKIASVPDSQSTASKLSKIDLVGNELENKQAVQIYVTSKKDDIDFDDRVDPKAHVESVSQSKEVSGDTNEAMILNEKKNSSTPDYFKAEVKAYVSYSKETMELTKTIQMSTKNGKSIFEGSFNIVKVICDRDRNDDVHGISNKDKMKEAVAFYSDRNPKNIKVIAKDLAAFGGLALFVKGQCLTKKSWNQIHICVFIPISYLTNALVFIIVTNLPFHSPS